jgi:hypothetical protein
MHLGQTGAVSSSVPGPLFLGETIDPSTHKRSGTAAVIKPDSLTTHGVIVGQTGSGKTGLAMVMIEEVLRSGVPAILIDPKGDLANLALTFPSLSETDFAPWVEGSSPAEVAKIWREGLASWGLGEADVTARRESTDVVVWTPGSSAARPLDLVGSLAAKSGGTDDPEARADEIEGTTSGLLGLLGIEADPLTSREHILIANLLDRAWSSGQALDLGGLIGQILDPPIRKLGVLDLDTFYPAKDRKELVLRLNGLAASPSFGAWAQGEPLDVAALLRDPVSGKPRASVISIAHLSDEERQFAMTRILSALITWMRAQSGTERLRALLYIDEVMGMVPPTANPPTKKPILTLMKQARAFGVGTVLATQNPVDVDYKVLSNAATWMVGRLQTERDRDRLLDGMRSAAGTVDPAALASTISGLAKREFVLQRPGADQPMIMTSRWSMAYLRGPLTREQLSKLEDLGLVSGPSSSKSGAGISTATPAKETPPRAPEASAPGVAVAVADDETPVAPPAVGGVAVRYPVAAAPWLAQVGADSSSTRLEAALVATFELTYDDTKADINETRTWEAIVFPLKSPFDPSCVITVDHDPRDFRDEAPAGARYVLPEAKIDQKAWWTAVTKVLSDQLVATQHLTVQRNTTLGLFARPGETPELFAGRCEAAADAKADEEGEELRRKVEAKLDKIRADLDDAQSRREALKDDQRADRRSEIIAGAGDLLGALLGGRRNARSIGRAVARAADRRSRGSGTRLADAENDITTANEALTKMEQQLADDLFAIEARWNEAEKAVDTVDIALERTDLRMTEMALVWLPVQPNQ